MATPEKRKPAPLVTGTGLEDSLAAETSDSKSRQRLWQDKNPLKRWSHIAVQSAIRRGILVRPAACEACGTIGPVDAHHHDHRLVLDVKFLCRGCHARLHAAARKVARHG